MKWKCSNNSCSASLLSKMNKTIHSSNREHVNHVSNNNQTIERHSLGKKVKR